MTRQPNLRLLFPDQWRWDWLGCETSPYGKVPVRTPHLDALIAAGPGIDAGRVCGDLVELMDLAPTLLDAADHPADVARLSAHLSARPRAALAQRGSAVGL